MTIDREALGRELIRLGTLLRLGEGPDLDEDRRMIIAAAIKPPAHSTNGEPTFPFIEKIRERFDHTEGGARSFLHVVIETDPEYHVPF